MIRSASAIPLPLLLLAACNQLDDGAAKTIASGDETPDAHIIAPSPDVEGAEWTASEIARTAVFGKPGKAPLLIMQCELEQDIQPFIRIVRQVAADANAQALFALQGPRTVARIYADSVESGGKWHWESVLPATDPRLDVFLEDGRIEATVPGGGTLKLSASDEPGKLLTECRSLAPQPAAEEQPQTKLG